MNYIMFFTLILRRCNHNKPHLLTEPKFTKHSIIGKFQFGCIQNTSPNKVSQFRIKMMKKYLICSSSLGWQNTKIYFGVLINQSKYLFFDIELLTLKLSPVEMNKPCWWVEALRIKEAKFFCKLAKHLPSRSPPTEKTQLFKDWL